MSLTKLSAYSSLSLSGEGALFCNMWNDVVFSIEGMKSVYQAKISTEPGTSEPDDVLQGFAFGYAGSTFEWKMEASAGGLNFGRDPAPNADPDSGGTYVSKFNIAGSLITSAAQHLFISGTELLPGVSVGDAANGLRHAGDTLSIVEGGTDFLSLNSSSGKMGFGSTGYSIAGEDGTLAAPTYGLRTDASGAGLYRDAVGRPTLVKSGVAVLTLSDTVISSPNVFQGGLGAVAAPTHSFGSQSNTGSYYNTGFGIAVAGTNVATFAADALTTTQPVRGANGALGTPTYAYTSSTNTGHWWNAATSHLSASVSGVLVMEANTANVIIPVNLTVAGTLFADVNFDGNGDTKIALDENRWSLGTEDALTMDIATHEIWTGGTTANDDTGTFVLVPSWAGGEQFLMGAGLTNSTASDCLLGRPDPALRLNVSALGHADYPETGIGWGPSGSSMVLNVRGMNTFSASVTSAGGTIQPFVTVPPGIFNTGVNVYRPGIGCFGDSATGLAWGIDFDDGTHPSLPNNGRGACWFAASSDTGDEKGDIIGYWDKGGITLEGHTLWGFGGGTFDPQLTLPNGTLTNLSLQFSGSTNMGLHYETTVDSVRLGNYGKWGMQYGNNSEQIVFNGSATSKAAPVITFHTNKGTGFHYESSGNIRYAVLVADGNEILRAAGDTVGSNHQVLIGADVTTASVTIPSLARQGDADTGVFWGSAAMGVTVDGVAVQTWDAAGENAEPLVLRSHVSITTQELVGNGVITVNWDAADYNQSTGGNAHYDSGASTTRLTAHSDGLYYVACSFRWSTNGNPAGNAEVAIRVNGAGTILRWGSRKAGSGGPDLAGALSDMVELDDTDYIEVIATADKVTYHLNEATMTLVRINDKV